MIGCLAGYSLGLAFGWFFVGGLLPRDARGFWWRVLQAALAIIVGSGVTSGLYFAGRVALPSGGSGQFAFEVAAMLLLAAGSRLAGRVVRKPCDPAVCGDRESLPSEALEPVPRWLIALASAVGLFAVVGFVFSTLRYPEGFDDALNIWNLHARFLDLGGPHWMEPFQAAREQGVLFSGHPDYPLLTPCSIARLWNWAGGITPFAPALVAGLLTLATVLLVASGVAIARGSRQGVLAGVTLTGTVALTTQGASQYADVPLAACITASVVLLSLNLARPAGSPGLLLLAGLSAGCAAWTKNEGLLFVGALLACHLLIGAVWHGPARSARQLAVILAGLLPFAAMVAFHKATLAPANDLVQGQSGQGAAERLLDGSRYVTIAAAWFAAYAGLTKATGVVLPLYVLLAGRDARWRRHPAFWLCTALVAAMLAGYSGVYLLTPQDLHWHLGTSSQRLLMHVWPSTIVAVFLLSASPEAARRD